MPLSYLVILHNFISLQCYVNVPIIPIAEITWLSANIFKDIQTGGVLWIVEVNILNLKPEHGVLIARSGFMSLVDF